MSCIQLMLQVSGGGRILIPKDFDSHVSLEQVMESVQGFLPPLQDNATLRYLQTSIAKPQWSTTTLQQLGLRQGRALLILEETTTTTTTAPNIMQEVQNQNDNDSVQASLKHLLQSNIDSVTKPCVVTILKLLDNVLSNPNEPKVRCIRLSNAAFDRKVGQVNGGVEVLLACGFERQTGPPPTLLSSSTTISSTEAVLVLSSTAQLYAAKRAIVKIAVEELQMDPDKDLPKLSKSAVAPASRDIPQQASSSSFDVYRGYRFDGQAAATGIHLGPDDKNYTSPTEAQLRSLQEKERQLEASLQRPLVDRGLVAGLPGTSTMPTTTAVATRDTSTSSDGSLLAKQFQKKQQERQQLQEGGFTTKAMRTLQSMEKKKVYSHVSLRIQFPDGSFVNAKFLPKETIATVQHVIQNDCLVDHKLPFDLYIAPPRRKLDPTKTLAQEELVPAAKVFCSWTTTNGPPTAAGAPVGSFLKPTLFQPQDAVTLKEELYPTAAPLVKDDKNNDKKEQEEELMRRMMGGTNNKTTKKSKSSGKPKWFKG